MQFLKFVSYMYEYQKGKKYENCGYAKVEFQQERIKMILQLRLPSIVNERLKIHLFTQKNGNMAGFLAGEGKLKWNALQMQLLIDKETLKQYQISFRDIKGIYIVSESGHELISEWDDNSLSGREFQLLEPKMMRKEIHTPEDNREEKQGETAFSQKNAAADGEETKITNETAEKNDNFKADTKEIIEDAGIEANQIEDNDSPIENEQTIYTQIEEISAEEDLIAGEQAEWVRAEENKVHEEEADAAVSDEREEEVSAAPDGIKQGIESADIEEEEKTDAEVKMVEASSGFEEAEISATNETQEMENESMKSAEFVKIDLRALRQLPRKEWHLASNRFLLHGFYNYHYLCMRKEDENTLILAVPGVYYLKEKAAAAMFGFSFFECEENREPEEGEFVFWCRKIRL